MLFARKYRLAVAVFAVLAYAGSPAVASDAQIPSISTTEVHRLDVVAQKYGKPGTVGKLKFAYRDGDVVRYFSSNENCLEYVADPKAFPDVEQGIRLALFGADPVLLFPNGTKDPTIGALLAGDPARYRTVYKGTSFAFAYKATQRAFGADPVRYMPAVGGYCLGAMSSGRVVPGDPMNTLWIPEIGVWAVFGSPRGPVIWAAMTSEERREKTAVALANYHAMSGTKP